MDYRSTSEVATETVESVQFGFMTDEEVKKLSFQKITKPDLLDSTIGQPVPGGLYDTALGSLDDITPCKSCGQRSFHCPGHSGHIELVSPVYNPLQFSMLFTVLQKTCFFCYHFKATAEQVGACLSKLKLIMKGDIIGARRLHLSPSGLDALDASLGELSEDSDSNLHSKMEDGCSEHVDQHEWTSFQLVEAMSILKDFLKKKTKTCGKCRAKNPTIYRPTFGWIHMKGMPDADMKANVIRGLTVNGPVADEDDDRSASEVENIDINGHGASNKKKRKKEKAASEFLKQKQSFSRSLLPSEVREILQRLWENEAQLCSFICNIQKGQSFTFWKNAGFTMFFLKTVLVAPIKFRPPARAGNSVMDHPQTVLLRKVLEANISLGNAYEQHAEPAYIIKQWMYLQLSVNILFDSKTAPGQAQKEEYGICQLLEKKDGIFRQKMMGKRVNFACRSVISPDPYLAVNEIGIPPVFALKLTYPERVTAWNVTRLRDAIVNGPEVHPGATHYVDKLSTTKLPSSRNMRIAISRKLPSSRGAVMHPGKNCDYEFEGKAVYRHLRDGDIVLVNRQPTLHKPSIIALKVRVLPGEKTLRFHYANCDSFNADFDGDEINVHLPQDEISRAEAYSIANADNQYIVPTRGDPKRALIQDHIVSAVILTKRDTFLTWEQFSELLYSSGLSNYKAHSFNAKSDRRVSAVDYEELIEYVPPAVIKPRPLWTGKQVITAILKHITRDHMPFTVKKRAKIAREYFGKGDSNKKTAETSRKGVENSEDKKKGDRVSKKKNTDDLGSRMVKDLGKNKKDSERKVGVTNYTMDEDVVFVYKNELLQGVIDKEQFGKYGLVHTVQELYGSSAAGNLLSVLSRLLTSFLQMYGFTCGVDDLLLVKDYDVQRKKLLDVCLNSGEEVHQQFIGREKEHLDPAEMQIELEKAVRRNGESAVALLDGMMRSKLNSLNSSLSKLFPEGLVKPFRKNCLSLMTLSGAKGGTFNFQQISLLLGQQELEGKRVPRMVSGKTLPCFPAWDTAARSGGYISDRYLTGLRPQEFYFHCMAGREGLVDTAVKTSRSGYLQRCLIKNLECLKVHYDYTVRDADGSIVQFRYGEDGVDVHQKNFMEEYEALAMNQEIIQSKTSFSIAEDACISKYIEEDDELPDQLRKKTEKFVEDASTAKNYGLRRQKDRANFVKLVKHKYLMSLAQPGEPVGVIAAQSVGEPSTQMTLNTFHHAGRGEMNVTLGIPRLQEILMTASIDIRTPTMTCPLHKSKSKDNAERLAAKLKRITVADLIEKMEVHVVPFAVDDHGISSIYKLKIKLYEPELYPPHTDISLEDCERVLGSIFLFELENAIKNHVLLLSKISGIKNFLSVSNQKASDETNEDDDTGKSTPVNDDDDDNDEGANEEGADDLGMDAQKEKRQATDEIDYEEDSLEDGKDLVDDGQDVEPVSEYGSEVEQADDEEEEENTKHDEHESDATERLEDGPASKEKSKVKTDKSKAKKQKKGKQIATKESDRVIYFIAEGSYFEVHCRFTDEPHILLTEIAQKTAKKVYIKNSGKIEQCKVVELNLDESIEGIPMLRKGKESRPALQAAGVDFKAFWNMQDELDINYISSNDIHAMLNTYGVEAARATIITEIFRVFNHYGVSVDMRHLTLIADYMTHTGGYQPMSRSGAIAGSVSPFAKMSFETASKFIVEAACYGEVDTLETPSARICLGLPAKVGTGCFDVMHQLEI